MSEAMILLIKHTYGTSTLSLQQPSLNNLIEHVEDVCGLSKEDQKLSCLGRNVESEVEFQRLLSSQQGAPFVTINVSLRLLGGKGGFGSLLRSARSVKKTTNFGACKDRNGNRLRDIETARRIAEHERIKSEGVVVEEKVPEPPPVDLEGARREKEYNETRQEILSNLVSSVLEGFKVSQERKQPENCRKREREEEEDLTNFWADELENEADEVEVKDDNETKETKDVNEEEMNIKMEIKEEKEINSTIHIITDLEQKILFDLDLVTSIEEIEQLTMEELKNELFRRKLKCGGTKRQRAERLWAVKGVDPQNIPLALLAPPPKPNNKRRKL